MLGELYIEKHIISSPTVFYVLEKILQGNENNNLRFESAERFLLKIYVRMISVGITVIAFHLRLCQ
jgi:hypothetical protein